jgi:serine/threonine-protein kinase
MTTPRLLSERYELGETLGYGGMAEVHAGRDTRLGREVAVKVLRADLARDPQFQLRFRREAQNAAALNHPAIVAVYDTGEVDGDAGPLPYIVMEYVDGQTLREIVKSSGPLSQQRVLEVMADVCAALDFSHRHQIIHRDVKPANIMINQVGAVKVMDFGIARALSDGQAVTQTAAVIGTAQYLSPEQAQGEPVDARSDVYAAGCVLYELLAGQPPFTGDSPVAVAYQHVREAAKPPSEVNPQVPPDLDAIVLKAISKNPANRYQTAAEMRSDLIRVLNGQRPLAPPVMSEEERTAMLAGVGDGPTRRIAPSGRRHALPPAWGGGPDEDRRRRWRLILLGIAIAAVVGVIVVVAAQLFGGPSAPPQVTVPSLVGQQAEAARQEATRIGLKPALEQADSRVDEIGKVVRTDPPEGAQVPEGSTLRLFVGKGPAEVRVPKVVGNTVTEADQILRTEGLVLGERRDEPTSDPQQVGRIISQSPEAGTTAPGQSAVNVRVGVQAQEVPIPDVSGRTLADAERILRAAGLTNVGNPGGSGVATGTDPSAGTSVAPNTRVTILSSDNVRMPELRGRTLDQARSDLAAAGFRGSLQVERRPVGDLAQNDVILQQTPAAGQPISPDQQPRVVAGEFQPGAG